MSTPDQLRRDLLTAAGIDPTAVPTAVPTDVPTVVPTTDPDSGEVPTWPAALGGARAQRSYLTAVSSTQRALAHVYVSIAELEANLTTDPATGGVVPAALPGPDRVLNLDEDLWRVRDLTVHTDPCWQVAVDRHVDATRRHAEALLETSRAAWTTPNGLTYLRLAALATTREVSDPRPPAAPRSSATTAQTHRRRLITHQYPHQDAVTARLDALGPWVNPRDRALSEWADTTGQTIHKAWLTHIVDLTDPVHDPRHLDGTFTGPAAEFTWDAFTFRPEQDVTAAVTVMTDVWNAHLLELDRDALTEQAGRGADRPVLALLSGRRALPSDRVRAMFPIVAAGDTSHLRRMPASVAAALQCTYVDDPHPAPAPGPSPDRARERADRAVLRLALHLLDSGDTDLADALTAARAAYGRPADAA